MNYYDSLMEGEASFDYYKTHAVTKRARELALAQGELEAWAAMVVLQHSIEEIMPMKVSY